MSDPSWGSIGVNMNLEREQTGEAKVLARFEEETAGYTLTFRTEAVPRTAQERADRDEVRAVMTRLLLRLYVSRHSELKVAA